MCRGTEHKDTKEAWSKPGNQLEIFARLTRQELVNGKCELTIVGAAAI
jgi:hypothetical protein